MKDLELNEEQNILKSMIEDINKAIASKPSHQKYLLEDLFYLEDELLNLEHLNTLRSSSRKINKYLKIDPAIQLRNIINQTKK